MATAAPVAKAAVGRADLLRLLALWGDGSEHAAAAITGFEYRPKLTQIPQPRRRKGKSELPEPKVDADTAPVLRAAHYSATVSKIDQPALPEDFEQRLSFAEGPDQAASIPVSTLPPERIPLAMTRRLTVFVEKQLRSQQDVNQWDVKQLIGQLARGLPPVKRKARQQRLRWAGNAMVIQMARQTEPLHADMYALAEVVHRRSAGRVPIYMHYAGGGWAVYDPDADRQTGCALPRAWRDLPTAPALNRLGGLAAGWPLQRAWPQAWQPGALLAAWQPPGATLPGKIPLAWWDVSQRIQTRRQLPFDSLEVSERRLNNLLALMTLAVNISPALLRALRCLLGLPAAAEVQAWSHPDVGCIGIAIALRPDRRDRYLEPLRALPLALRQQAAECVAAQHLRLSLAITFAESMFAKTHAPGAAVMSPERQYQQWARRLANEPDTDDSQELAAFLTRQGHRTDAATWQQSPEFVLAWGVANPHALQDPTQLPAHFPLHLLETVRAKVLKNAKPPTLQGLRLRQQDGCLCFDLCDAANLLQPAPGPANVLAHWSSRPVVQWRGGADQPWHRLALEPGMAKIDLSKQDHLELTDGQFTCHVELAKRPPWALEWARNREGLYALAPNPWGAPLKLSHPQPMAALPGVAVKLVEMVGKSQDVFERKTLNLDAIGLVAGLSIKPGVSQAFRYLPPGQFLMGSPLDEPDRDKDEGPQHPVTLTEGFWLADTACTQGLWLAVMGGKNPSHFTGDPELPVENVSWDDVQQFLAKLQAYLPADIEAVLPTEAQWEYACRAGTVTPFNFGEQASTAQVNYDGNYPYNDGPKGEYRQKTVPVKALPANAWGLYQMHGNVWEWCADSMRKYTEVVATNPSGATGQGVNEYAVRGGGWLGLARGARSAQRHRGPRGGRDDCLGFRFALRSKVGQGAAGPVLDGQSPLQGRDGPVMAARSARRKK